MNTFGSTTTQFQLCDAVDRQRFHRDAVTEKINSFYCPLGRWPFRGWIILPRYEYTQLNSYSTTLQLSIDNLVLKNLSIVQAQCVTRGLASDPNALYLIELTDGRGILSNKWFQFPVNAQYNIRSPAYRETYYTSSMNSGVPWTWSTMIGDLWSSMTTFLGTYPGLPLTPTGTPENWYFVGTSAWDAMCDILDRLGMAVACDLTSATPYSIVYTGADDAVFTALQSLYATNLLDDREWLDRGSGRTPKTIVVYFKYRTIQYGLEETVRGDSLQWESSPMYPVTVTAPVLFTNATGTHFLHDDFTIRRDIDGVASAADIATTTSIAAERCTQYFAKIYSATSGYMSQTYSSILPFVTGSQVDGVCWYRDEGWRTQILRGPEPPWKELYA